MRVGSAQADITPRWPIAIAGLMRERRGQYVHDPLTLNAAAFADARAQVVAVSCDLLLLPDPFVRQVQSACEQRYGMDGSRVIIACTHTHDAPCTADFFPGKVDPAFMESLHANLVSVVGNALSDLEDATVYAGEGSLSQMGYNRRALRSDGSVEEFYGSWNEDFIGLEGPRDGAVGVVWALGREGDTKVVVVSFSSHPTAMLESCYSADIVGAVRSFLAAKLGNDVSVVYLTGASGNTALKQLDDNAAMDLPWLGPEGIERAGAYMGNEILRLIAETEDPMVRSDLAVAHATELIPLRPWPASFDPASLPEAFRDFYTAARESWPDLLRNSNPAEVRLNVIRIGDAVICTNPAELYVEHGMDIKARSEADVTLLSELTDGYVGYVPTKEAFEHGGYSTWPARSSKLAACAGEMIVESTGRLLKELL